MLFGLLFLVGACLAAPVSLDKVPCQTQDVNLNGPYSLPLTALTDMQYCTYTFKVPAGQFAFAKVIAYDMNSNGGEGVILNDISGFVQIMGPSSGQDYSKFNSTLAWPQTFTVNFQSFRNTNMKVQVDINLQKNLLGQNVQSTQTTDTDGSSFLVYFQDAQEGQTFNFNSKNNLVNLKAALAYGSGWLIMNNIFVYDDGVLIGTLLTAYTNQNMVSKSKNLQLYVARSVAEMGKGAALVTDNSNLAKSYYHFVTYVPLDRPDHSMSHLLYGDATRNGALTIIGDKDNSTPFDVRQLIELNDNTAPFSYISGGPKASDSAKTTINISKLPLHIGNNLATFYIASGEGIVKYTLS